jgi:cobalamin synthase
MYPLVINMFTACKRVLERRLLGFNVDFLGAMPSSTAHVHAICYASIVGAMGFP